eukprot:6212780-Pleurochrysis_carterae.AAC.7
MAGRKGRNEETEAARRVSGADVIPSPSPMETGRGGWCTAADMHVRCGGMRASKHRLNGGVNISIMLEGALLRK